MIVLMELIQMYMPRPRVAALHVGRTIMSEQRWAFSARTVPTLYTQPHPLAPIPVPTPRHMT